MTLRNVIVMAVLAVLCALAWYALKDEATGPERLPATWPTFAKDEVTRISMTHQDRTLVLRRRVDRTDSWEVEVGTSLARADASAVADLLTQISRQEVFAKHARGEASAADVGIGETSSSIELTLPGGPVRLRYGRKSREGSYVYADSGPGTDVWGLGGNVAETILASVDGGMRAKHLTDVRQPYDVGKVEVVRGGVTAVEAAVDPSGIWRFRQPFKGHAEPAKFADWLSKLVNTQVANWPELDAVDLAQYGLDAPQAEVVLTPRREGVAATILVGKATADGAGVFAVEKGYAKNVAAVPKRFLDAVLTAAADLRDPSFSRIGVDGVAVTVRAGDASYKLQKEGSSWDVVEPDRFPGDDTAIRDALKLVREWHTYEFLDAAKPEDHGIDGKTSIEIQLEGGGKTTLLFGTARDDGKRHAQRKDADGDGGVEVVDGAPFDLFARGYPQFRRKVVRDFGTTWLPEIERLARDRGKSDESASIQTVAVERTLDGADPTWKLSGPGVTGALDTAALNAILNRVSSLRTSEWLFWDPSKNDAMGFVAPPVAETMSLTVRFSTRTGHPPGGAEQVLMVGRKRPEGGYFARMGADPWAFVMSEEDVAELSRSLTKTEKSETPPKQDAPKKE